MLFALVANDRPQGLEDRLKHRAEHLRHLAGLGEKLVVAGPFLDVSGNPNGSIVVIEAADLSEAEEVFLRDPFIIHGVFASYDVRPWRLTINNLGGAR